jgi:hypothetical protein
LWECDLETKSRANGVATQANRIFGGVVRHVISRNSHGFADREFGADTI